jgi:hypothetical protein
VRGDRTNPSRGHGYGPATQALETPAERTASISEQARRRGTLSHCSPCSPSWVGLLSGVHDGEAVDGIRAGLGAGAAREASAPADRARLKPE